MTSKKLKKRNIIFFLIFLLILISLIIFTSKKESNEVNNLDNESESFENVVEFDSDTPVVFEDQNLEAYIREELGILSGDIYAGDMLELYSVNISRLGVVSLVGLEYAVNLDAFTVAYENINSLNPLKNLSSLKRLSLRYSTIESLPISFNNNVSLTHVSIVDTPVEDISFLSHMKDIVHLTASDAMLTDISPVKDLDKVEQLNLRGNKIEDISAISGITSLKILNLQDNQVSNVESLADLNNLENLVLSFNPIYNLSPIVNISSLKELTVYYKHEVKHHIFDDVKVLEDMGISVQYTR